MKVASLVVGLETAPYDFTQFYYLVLFREHMWNLPITCFYIEMMASYTFEIHLNSHSSVTIVLEFTFNLFETRICLNYFGGSD